MTIDYIKKQRQFLLFVFIGIVNTFIHGTLLVIGVEFFKITVVMAHFFAFIAANIISYFLNGTLTFRVNLNVKRYVKFFIASMGSLGLTLTLSWLIDIYGAHYLIGFLMIVIVVPLISFFLMKFWAFGVEDASGNGVCGTPGNP